MDRETCKDVGPEEVFAVVEGVPNMNRKHGQIMTDFIREHRIRNVLELGFNHGVSTSYIAAAARGCVVTIDLASRLNLKPSLEEHLSALGLLSKVCIFYEHTTYNWRLRAFLRMDPRPAFDLCFIDGAHTWEADALAFLLSVQLLQGGGFIIFDDLNYSFDKSPWWQQRRSAELATLPIDEQSTSHVREIFELLVKPHPEIAEAWEGDCWAYAQKHGTRTSGIDRTMWRELMGQAARVKEHARKTTD